MYLWLTLVVAAIVVGYAMWKSKNSWRRVEVSSGATEGALYEKYQTLRDNGIRCRLKPLEPGSAMTAATGVTAAQPDGGRTALEVHQSDFERAKEVLDEDRPAY